MRADVWVLMTEGKPSMLAQSKPERLFSQLVSWELGSKHSNIAVQINKVLIDHSLLNINK